MNPSLLASLLAGAMITGGLLLTVVGLRRRPAPPPRPSRRLRLPSWLVRMPR